MQQILKLLTLLSIYKSKLSPVLLIPGDGANNLEAKLTNRQNTPHWYCSKNSDWYTLWLDLKLLAPGAVDCWCENVKLLYDENQGKFTNQQGVEVRVPNYGNTESVKYNLYPFVKYYIDIINKLESLGYKDNQNIKAAPYDFRYTAHSNQEYVKNTVRMIETMFEQNQNTKVTLISHSMGGLMTLYILQNQTQEWKDKYINKWIAIAAPLGGTRMEGQLYVSGNNFGIKWVSSFTVRDEQRSYETNFWMLPTSKVYGDSTFVKIGNQAYSSKDYDALFERIQFPLGKKVWRKTQDILQDLKAPQVPVQLVFGNNVDTVESVEYEDINQDPKKINYGPGDGTVNEKSLKFPMNWQKEQDQPVQMREFQKVSHTDILAHKGFLEDLVNML